MFAGMELSKLYFGEKIFNQLMNYLKNDPVKNLPRLLDLACKAPIQQNHREKIRLLKHAYETNPIVKNYIIRLLTGIEVSQYALMVNFIVNAGLIGIPRQRKSAEKIGCCVPFTILIDPTGSCNLRCRGCWAGNYEKRYQMSFELVDRIIEEAKELGIYAIVLSGGEPMRWPYLFDLFAKHKEVAFQMFTNGTLIDEIAAARIRKVGNVTPVLSLEGRREATDERRGKGVFDRVMSAMDYLKANGTIFGVGLTISRQNCEEVLSDQFIDLIVEKGALYGFSFLYIPIGSNPDYSMMVTAQQRGMVVDRLRYIRNHKLIQIIDFWNDGHLIDGCIAGGRRYFHINSCGDVEPCAFAHFAVDNIKEKSLREVLGNPVFKAYQKRQPFSKNLLRPCPIIDVPEGLREIVAESNAHPCDAGGGLILSGAPAAAMDRIAAEWKKEADKKWHAEPEEITQPLSLIDILGGRYEKSHEKTFAWEAKKRGSF